MSQQKKTMLYGYAPNDMPVLTADGYMPRIDWLKQEEKKLNEHGIVTKLKEIVMKPESDKYKSHSALMVQDKSWTHDQWVKIKKKCNQDN